MKIIKIAVTKLFGMFDHEVPLNADEHITIIHGPNGYGKTILLTLVNAFFEQNYPKIRQIPFEQLTIYFDDESNLCISKDIDQGDNKKEKSKKDVVLTIRHSKTGSKARIYIESQASGTEGLRISAIALAIQELIPELERVGIERWLNRQTAELLSLNDIQRLYADKLSVGFPKMKAIPQWLKDIEDETKTHLIETQRLLRVPEEIESPLRRKLRMTHAVDKYSEELVDAITRKLAEYGSLSQSLDRTFPSRLVKLENSNLPAAGEIEEALKELEEKRSRLISSGLLDKQQDTSLMEPQELDESNLKVLTVYIDDVRKKLSVFDSLADKIDLLLNIINRRFLHKTMTIDQDKGFRFENSNGQTILPTSLSSGEQHQLVLLYEMLFKVSKDTLILIDEPELSLHVGWQQEFLEDLQEITRLTGFDVLLATHSPQIINDRWDLTVELEGPKQ